MQQDIGIEFLKALNRYFTPVAIGVVLLAVLCTPELPKPIFAASMALIVASVAFNTISAVYIIEHPSTWRTGGYVRVAVNLAFSAACYLLLRSYWPMIWVLFSLGPVAMAFYGDVSETFATLLAVALVMGGRLWWEQNQDPRAWGEAGLQLFYILLLSLFLIRVAQLIRKEKSARRV